MSWRQCAPPVHGKFEANLLGLWEEGAAAWIESPGCKGSGQAAGTESRRGLRGVPTAKLRCALGGVRSQGIVRREVQK